MCIWFFDKKDFRKGYTCASSLIAPLKASSLLIPPLLVVQLELRCPSRRLSLIGFWVTGWRTKKQGNEEACSQYSVLKHGLCPQDKVTVVIIFPLLTKLVSILNSSRMASDYVDF